MAPSSHKNKNESAAAEIVLKLKQAGFEAYFVGGCVRDMLLNKQPSDFDVATSALPDQVEALFSKTIPVGKAFGVIIVQIKGAAIEVATFREDLGYTDGRRPKDIRFSSAKEDALRRDFTINGLYYDVERKKVVDWVGGQKDLELKIIRTIGDPFKRFEEDKLRMLRAVRFSANLDFPIEAETLKAIQAMKDQIVCVSMERVRDELVKMFCGNNPDKGLMLLHESGLFEALYPEAVFMNRCSAVLPEGTTATGVQLLTNI
ncbi:MAG: CCA tRNA nucleotidyltransferase, partial [Candidatus Omnitrophica bacterium]|nr:CCA tRNA nucleotidyltransferase [Candidatus Omnitrophota bacterium]